MPACNEHITVLKTGSSSQKLAKTWLSDGTIDGTASVKQFKQKSYPVHNLGELYALLESLRHEPQKCVIRGEYIGDEAASMIDDPERKTGFVLRRGDYFKDVARSWVMFDVDGYKHALGEQASAVEILDSWVSTLPDEFQGASYIWHLSGSQGHPSGASGVLKTHVWFWLDGEGVDSATLQAYMLARGVHADTSVAHPIQIHYTADPIIELAGVDADAMLKDRMGFVQGWMGDSVSLNLEGLDVARIRKDRDSKADEFVDPREKRGFIGAFCRVFSVPEVLEAEWFVGAGEFIPVSGTRWTWAGGNGAGEGLIVDELGLVNTHNSAPHDTIRRRLNAFDVVRVYMFGDLDEGLDQDVADMSQVDPTLLPSYAAARAFVLDLEEVQDELERAAEIEADETVMDDGAAPESADSSGETTQQDGAGVDTEADRDKSEKRGQELLEKLEWLLDSEGVALDALDKGVLKAIWKSGYYRSSTGRLHFINKDGALVDYAQVDWVAMLSATFGKPFDAAMIGIAFSGRGADANADAKLAAEFVKSLWSQVLKQIKLYRLRGLAELRVDMFAKRNSVRLTGDSAQVTFKHSRFDGRSWSRVAAGVAESVKQEVIDEFRTHLPQFDAFLQFLLHSRFASDRRKAFLWMQMLSGWGKGFLFEGVLGQEGLGIVCAISAKELEGAFEGKPLGMDASLVFRSWMLWVDEFKSAKSEIKQLNNSIYITPKHQMRSRVDVYAKIFTSAESVDSLAGSEGVESQYIERFSFIEPSHGSGRLDDRPVFSRVGKVVYRSVLAEYAAGVLNAGVERLRGLGLVESSRVADVWLDDWHHEHGIHNSHDSLDDNFESYADEVRRLVVDYGRSISGGVPAGYLASLPSAIKSRLASSVLIVRGGLSRKGLTWDSSDQFALVKRPVALVKEWINANIDRSQVVMLSHKAKIIADLVAERDTGRPLRFYVAGDDDTVQELVSRSCTVLLRSAGEIAEGAELFNDEKLSNILIFKNKKETI